MATQTDSFVHSVGVARVLVCGLLAGIAANLGEFPLNRLLLGREWEEAMRSLNRPPIGEIAVLSLLAMELGLGVLMIWLYAVTRPHFGAWWRAAVAAGLAAWCLAYVVAFGWPYAMGVFSARIYWTTVAWTLIEIPAAAVAGAWAYERLRLRPCRRRKAPEGVISAGSSRSYANSGCYAPQRTVPESCASLEEVRAEIDRIDARILGLLGERSGYVGAAARLKSSESAIAAPDRIRTMLEARRNWARQEGLDPDIMETAYRLLVDQFGRSRRRSGRF